MNTVPNIPSDSSDEADRNSPTLVALDAREQVVRGESPHKVFLDSSGDLDSLVATLAVSTVTPAERAHGVLAVLRRIVQAESGSYNLSVGLNRCVERLWCGPVFESLIRSVHSRAVALTLGRVGQALDEGTLLNDLRTVVEWYSTRRANIAACRREGFIESDGEALFNLHVAHDAQRWGVEGMRVSCGLRFIARAHETVWFKVTARCDGAPIETRPGWEGWRDETDSAALQSDGASRPFAAITPIRPRRQRVYADRVEQFVPYLALHLPSGRHEIELEVGIYSDRGELLVSAALVEAIQIPPSDSQVLPVPAPQALGLWPADPVSGDSISFAGSHVRFEGDPGWENQVLESSVDIALVGMAGRRAILEFFLRREDGVLVERKDEGAGRPHGAALAQVALFPQQVVSHLAGIRAGVVLQELDLAPGPHRLLLELVVRSPDQRIICGAFEQLDVEVNAIPVDAEFSAPEPHVVADGAVDVAGVSIATLDHQGQLSLGVTALIGVHDWENTRHQMVVSLECRDGSPVLNAGAADRPVTRSFWFGGESGRPPGEIQPLRAVFDAREFARFMKTRSAADRDIIARVVIANDVGRTLFETTRRIGGDFVTEVKAALPAQRPTIPAQIVALELDEGLTDGTAAVLRVTLNIERSALPVNRLTVHYEFLDESGAPLTESHSPSELAGTVVAVELSLRGKAMVGRWYQTHLTIPLAGIPPNGSRPTTIVASTFSSNGEYWETVQSRLSPARMTSLKSRVSRRSQAAALPTPVSAEGSDVASSGAGALFAKLRSALIG